LHKIFAKPSFLGKSVVYLTQCHSTNEELAQLVKMGHVKEGTLLYTGFQTKGKGQRGNIWVSEPNKNVLCSIFVKPEKVKLSDQVYLNLIVGLAVIRVLDKLFPNKKYLKWPNDIYVGEDKIGGILVEVNVRNGLMDSAILGIGLNVNQSQFSVPNATSILLKTNHFHDIDDVIEHVLCEIEKGYNVLMSGKKDELLFQYYQRLMWINELHEFKSFNESFLGKIKGIDEYGRLLIEMKNGVSKAFGIKEVEFVK